MAASEAVRSAFGRAADDDEFRERLFSDPAAAGRGLGLRGADLYELVGTIEHANRSKEDGRRHLIVMRDVVDQQQDGSWPFEALDDEQLIERAAIADEYASHLYRCVGLGIDSPAFIDGIEQWAEALESEVARRAEVSPGEINTSIALALINAKTLQQAAHRSKNRSH